MFLFNIYYVTKTKNTEHICYAWPSSQILEKTRLVNMYHFETYLEAEDNERLNFGFDNAFECDGSCHIAIARLTALIENY